MFPTTQCRKCIRELHYHEPFHRIESWTGKFFRPAAMWEVGGYVLIRHHGDHGLCNTLKFQKDHLDDLQSRQDIIDQNACRNLTATSAAGVFQFSGSNDMETSWGMECDPDQIGNDQRTDDLILAEMDSLLSQQHASNEAEVNESLLQDEEDEDNTECEIEALEGFKGYLGHGEVKNGTAENVDATAGNIDGTVGNCNGSAGNNRGTAGTNISSQEDPSAAEQYQSGMHPKKDAFDNHYVRIAHTNGIHHLGVVTCSCRGVDDLPVDLMYSRLIPSSFTVIRTLFTTMALDTFRLANLEMKASAYSYFQFIHRLTSKTTSNVPDLYPDLRKLSRAWRWMKKLKWAGFGHKTADPSTTAAGELSIFCPACPQPDVNLPEDWKTDQNR